jgi:class 3 adenylate cyclase
VAAPSTRYARSGDIHVAYQVVGDGFLASFDGPARAIRCAFDIRDSLGRTGLVSDQWDLYATSN